MRRALVLASVALFGLVAPPATARDGSASRGKTLARATCARCHGIGSRGVSPMPEAPAFRTLARRFPIDDLADILVEGVERRHPAMPAFQLDPSDADDLTAYLKTLRR
ncbi:cytochrome C [Methylobacterium sp. Leaf465]|uniref:c-type cytochrome n=1 Tax=unclassified Methylobacterium TaxID=2615210 RepID=UPI0006FEDB36|nr:MULTISPECIES: cytochrome c [unclassified Methylobacterium]KQT70373.1 cytochrome C [Methylobacterium sp. Leaf465]KQU19017.1 cytochrome C [Methylobacterium sp. Leaf94]